MWCFFVKKLSLMTLKRKTLLNIVLCLLFWDVSGGSLFFRRWLALLDHAAVTICVFSSMTIFLYNRL